MALGLGTRVGSYEILAPLGAGGMGEVYRARDTRLDRTVAIKILPETFARDPDRMARFGREAKVLASLNHPNIATIHGLEDSGNTRALIMELVEGPTLGDRIQQGPIPTEEALRIARQTADALEYAHEKGIIHRDLKPANIKFSREDSVKILDFGLAKAVEGDAASMDVANSPTLTRMATMQGVLLGTAAYMSPEQAKAKPVDRRADIWAFGCVLYEMLTGRMAFTGETVSDTLASVIKEEPNWSLLPSNAPARVRVLLQRCLQKDPKQRLRDIGDARISLDEVLSGASEPSTSGVTATSIPAPFWRRALPWAIASVAVLVALAVGWSRLANTSGAGEPASFHVAPPEGVSLAASGVMAVSPDGRQLAFLAVGADGVQRVWVRPLNSLEAHPLPDSQVPGGEPIFWSFDSRYILFDGEGKLEKIDLGGGPAQTLCDNAASVVGGSWNRDGVIIFGQAPGPVMKVPASGGSTSPVTALDPSRGDIDHDFPTFLPDGRHFIYRVTSSKPGNSGIYVGSLDAKPSGQDPKQLLATDNAAVYVPPLGSAPGQLLFVRDGTLVSQPFDANQLKLTGAPVPLAEQIGSSQSYGFFSASPKVLFYRTGASASAQLTWFDRDGKPLAPVSEASRYISLSLSPDGKQAAVTRMGILGTRNDSVWLLDLSRGTSTRFTFGSSSTVSPVWSPDGSRIIFVSLTAVGGDIYEKLASGVGEGELVLKSSAALPVPTSWSRDGRFLLFTTLHHAEEKASVWVLPLEGDKKPFPFLSTGSNNTDGQFSPDGRLMAYVSDESGRNEIYVRTFSPSAATASDSGGKWLISTNGGVQPHWRGDGKELYYLAADGKLMAVVIATSPAFQAGVPAPLFQGPPPIGEVLPTVLPRWDVASDGKRFLFPAVAAHGATPFTVVLNWQDMLKQQQ